MTDSRGVTSYEYDIRDRLVKQTDPDSRSLSYAYDAAGNRVSLTIPSGTTSFTFDALNRLATVTDPDGGVTSYTYDAVGNRASVTYPNGAVAEYTYDSLNRLTNLLNRKSGGDIISSYAYTLAAAGNRIMVVEDTGRKVNYNYDKTYKLTNESINDLISGSRMFNYTYDAVGNRLIRTDDGVTTTYTYDANDRLMNEGGNTYTYDKKGNTLTKVNITENILYSYDFQNRLVNANITDDSGSSVVEYTYDADGIRVQKTVEGTNITNYLVDKNQPLAQVLLEADGAGRSVVSYIYGDDLLSQNRNGSLSYYHYDGQMSTRHLTDTLLTVTDTYKYDAFGRLLSSSGVTINSYLYTGEQFDPNLGFYYLRTRYNNPDTGRFLTQDPLLGSIFEPITLHRYLYVNGNPINNIDPSGMITLVDSIGSLAISGILFTMFINVVKPQNIFYKVRDVTIMPIAEKIIYEAIGTDLLIESWKALQILKEEFRKYKESDESGYNRGGKHRMEIMGPSGLMNLDKVIVKKYISQHIEVTILAGGGAGRLIQFKYRVGQSTIPGQGYFGFRADYMQYTTMPPFYSPHFHLVWGTNENFEDHKPLG